MHRYQLCPDGEAGFTVKMSSHDLAGRLVEAVEMDELQADLGFPDVFSTSDSRSVGRGWIQGLDSRF
ncbi:MAG: hypothetical protein AB1513_02760 [Pseudomonadota bacterium]